MTVSADREPIWLPDPDEVTAANVSRFARWLTEHGRTQLTGNYLELWRWSVSNDRKGTTGCRCSWCSIRGTNSTPR